MYSTGSARSDETHTRRDAERNSSAIQQSSPSPASQDTPITAKPWMHRAQEDGKLPSPTNVVALSILQKARHVSSVAYVNSCIRNMVALAIRKLWYSDRALGCSLALSW